MSESKPVSKPGPRPGPESEPATEQAAEPAAESVPKGPTVALFVTCLVDVMRPGVGFAAVRLLEAAGCRVTVPEVQTCCGQPAFNAGDRAGSLAIAKQVIAAFEGFDYVVVPSGSCAGMIHKHYPALFEGHSRDHTHDNGQWPERARSLSARTRELVSFLRDERNYEPASVRFDATISYHDSCSGLRELGIRQQPRDLLAHVEGARVVEASLAEACCGFGGLFCIKYPDISAAMADRKIDEITASGADVLSGGDLGCLMNLAGRMSRRHKYVDTWHIAEILAGMASDKNSDANRTAAPICDPAAKKDSLNRGTAT